MQGANFPFSFANIGHDGAHLSQIKREIPGDGYGSVTGMAAPVTVR